MTILFNIFSLDCRTNFRQYFSANICRRCLKSKHSLHWHAIWWDTFLTNLISTSCQMLFFFSFMHQSWGITALLSIGLQISCLLRLILKQNSQCLFLGIILEYEQGGNLKTKSIDLLDLKVE